jgi:hypothetical protein
LGGLFCTDHTGYQYHYTYIYAYIKIGCQLGYWNNWLINMDWLTAKCTLVLGF